MFIPDESNKRFAPFENHQCRVLEIPCTENISDIEINQSLVDTKNLKYSCNFSVVFCAL